MTILLTWAVKEELEERQASGELQEIGLVEAADTSQYNFLPIKHYKFHTLYINREHCPGQASR